MEDNLPQEQAANHFYARAKHLLDTEKRSPEETIDILMKDDGLDQEAATKLVSFAVGGASSEGEINDGDSGAKDMIIGGLFCVGGTIATIADIGYIFWGAILFGGIQFIKGVIKASS